MGLEEEYREAAEAAEEILRDPDATPSSVAFAETWLLATRSKDFPPPAKLITPAVTRTLMQRFRLDYNTAKETADEEYQAYVAGVSGQLNRN